MEITIFLIAVGLAMDAFAVSVSNGICTKDFGKRDALRQGIYFGAFQFIMPLLGWVLGSSVRESIALIDHWIAFVLLAGIGGNMIRDSRKQEDAEGKVSKKQSGKELALQGLATSIDALAVGISFALLHVHIVYASAIIGVVAFLLSYLGGIFGKGVGKILEKKAEFIGGVVLIGIGLKILAEHLLL